MPDSWTRTTLGEVADYQNGYPFKPSELTGRGRPVVRIKQLLDPLAEADLSDVEVGPRHQIDDGDLIFSWSGTLASRIWNRGPALLNQHLFRVVERPGVERGWLHLALDHAVDALMEKTHGTTMKHVTKKVLESHPVLLPSLSEQRRIVDLIAALDAVIIALIAEGTTLSVAQAAARNSLMDSSLGWPLVELGDVLSIARGGSPRPIDKYFTDEPSGVNWIKIGDVPPGGKYIDGTAQRIKQEGVSRSRRVHPGDFLLSNSMSWGRPYIVRIEGCIHDGWLVLSDDNHAFDQDYLYNVLRSRGVQDQFASLASGSAVKNLNIKLVEGVRVALPPIGEQTTLSATLNALESTQEHLSSEADALSELRAVLLGGLLRREIEIPETYDSLLAGAT